MKVFSVFLLSLVALVSSKTTFHGHQVLRVTPHSETQLKWMQDVTAKLLLNEWSSSKGIGASYDIMVPPEISKGLLKEMSQRGVSYNVMIKDVQKLIDENAAKNIKAKLASKSKNSDRIDHTFYRTLDEINTELDNFESGFPSLFSSYSAGTTFEGRDIRVELVSSGAGRQALWFDCGIHAREWVSPATCLYMLDQLTMYGSNPEVTNLLDTYDFHVLVVANPDGYQYTWDQNRLWRKNRKPFGTCSGVDCNRNFDSNFGGEGSSDIVCADTYHGPSAFSEEESAAIRDATTSISPKMFMSIHAYSQFWMIPYGYTINVTADHDELIRVSTIGATALTAVYGTQFQVGAISTIIYVASGGSVDWSYDGIGVTYSMALELRDTGTFGFELPPNQIEPTATETWEGIKAAINAMV